MTTEEKTTREILDMPPQLTAFEAMLGTFRPTDESDMAARSRSAILLEQCRVMEKELTPDARREKLVETFQKAEAEEISVSLNLYTRQVRFSSALTGGFIGLILGVLLTILGLAAAAHWFSTPPTPTPPIREIHYYQHIDPNMPFSSELKN